MLAPTLGLLRSLDLVAMTMSASSMLSTTSTTLVAWLAPDAWRRSRPSTARTRCDASESIITKQRMGLVPLPLPLGARAGDEDEEGDEEEAAEGTGGGACWSPKPGPALPAPPLLLAAPELTAATATGREPVCARALPPLEPTCCCCWRRRGCSAAGTSCGQAGSCSPSSAAHHSVPTVPSPSRRARRRTPMNWPRTTWPSAPSCRISPGVPPPGGGGGGGA